MSKKRFPTKAGPVLFAFAIFPIALSACRLGSNNQEKLDALQAGLGYDENGVILPESSPLPWGTLALSGTDPLYRTGETVSLSITNVANEARPWASLKLQYASDGTTFGDVADLSTSASSATWTIPSSASSARAAKLRILASDAKGETTSAESASFQVVSQVSMIAGIEVTYGYRDGVGTNARFRYPIAMTKMGSALYITDKTVVRKVDLTNPASPVVSTIAGLPEKAGNVDGVGNAARFGTLGGITNDGTYLYVSDLSYHVIRRINPSTREAIAFAGTSGSTGTTDGAAASAKFNAPQGMALTGSNLYVADKSNHAIRKIDLGTNTVSTLAGMIGSTGMINANGTSAKFNTPCDLTTDGSYLYVADYGNRMVRKVDLASPYAVTGVAGTNTSTDQGWLDGVGAAAIFHQPTNLTISGSALYVAETGYGATIRKIDLGTNTVSTYAGAPGDPNVIDGAPGTARLFQPRAMVIDGSTMYFTQEVGSYNLRKINMGNNEVSTIAGAPPSIARPFFDNHAKLYMPTGLLLDGNTLYFTQGFNHVIRKVDLGTNQVSSLYGKNGEPGSTNGNGTSSRFKYPDGMVKVGNDIFVADQYNHVIRRIDSSGNVTTLTGTAGSTGSADGNAATARFNRPMGLAAIGTNTIYVTEYLNNKIRKIDITDLNNPSVSTFAGPAAGTTSAGTADGATTTARFSGPSGITTDGTYLYVADYSNHAIRKIDMSGNVTTIAGTKGSSGSTDGDAITAAKFNNPRALALSGNNLYINDYTNYKVRKLDLGTNTVSTIAGIGSTGTFDGGGTVARFNGLMGMAVNGNTLYVSDYNNHLIRKIDLTTNSVTTLAGSRSFAGATDGPALWENTYYGEFISVGSELYNVWQSHVSKVESNGSLTAVAGSVKAPGMIDGAIGTSRFTLNRGAVAHGQKIYVSDNGGHVIRMVDLTAGTVTTIAGQAGVSGSTDGNGTSARFTSPTYMATDGSYLYVSDNTNYKVRRVDLSTYEVTTIAGTGSNAHADGIGTAAAFKTPQGMVLLGNTLYVANSGSATIRKIDLTDPANAVVTTYAGTPDVAGYQDGPVANALFHSPKGMSTDGKNLYVIDEFGGMLRKIQLSTGTVSTTVGDSGLFQGSFMGSLSNAGMINCAYGVHYTAKGLYVSCMDYFMLVH